MDLDIGPSTRTAQFSPVVIRLLPKVGPNKTNRWSTPIKDERRIKLSKKMNPKRKSVKRLKGILKRT